jgi:hypothetical protein
MADDDTGIGILPDGSLNIVNADDPPFKPIVLDKDGNEIGVDALDAGDAA